MKILTIHSFFLEKFANGETNHHHHHLSCKTLTAGLSNASKKRKLLVHVALLHLDQVSVNKFKFFLLDRIKKSVFKNNEHLKKQKA